MGFFEDIEEMLDDEGVGDISIEIITNKKDLDERIKELKEEGFTLTNGEPDEPEQDEEDEDLPEDEEELEEVLRMKAKRQFSQMVKEHGLERAKKELEISMHRGIIDNLLEQKLPLDPEVVEKYNDLCRKLNPENCDPDVLDIHYLVLRHIAEKKKKEICDG